MALIMGTKMSNRLMMVSSRFGLLSLLVWMGNLPYYPLGITLEASGWLTQGT